MVRRCEFRRLRHRSLHWAWRWGWRRVWRWGWLVSSVLGSPLGGVINLAGDITTACDGVPYIFVAPVAQGIEHRSPKAGVVRSNRIRGTLRRRCRRRFSFPRGLPWPGVPWSLSRSGHRGLCHGLDADRSGHAHRVHDLFLTLYLLQNRVWWSSVGVSEPVRRAVELTTDRGRRKFASNGKSGIPPGTLSPADTARRSVFFLPRTGRCRPARTWRGKGTTRTTGIRLCGRASSPVVMPPHPSPSLPIPHDGLTMRNALVLAEVAYRNQVRHPDTLTAIAPAGIISNNFGSYMPEILQESW